MKKISVPRFYAKIKLLKILITSGALHSKKLLIRKETIDSEEK